MISATQSVSVSAPHARVREARSLARDLERALENGELYPVLQPRMALAPLGGLRLSGAEALVRWQHPERGAMRPDQFIPVAEATGLIAPLGEFMLRGAAKSIASWRERFGGSPGIAVNVSARQFTDTDLPRLLERVLAGSGLPAGCLEIEITETAAMRDVAHTAAVLEDLRAIGVPVSIDDFGTGYSSLNYLRRFAVNAIKIDKSFVDEIGVDPHANAICDAILRLGQSLDIKVVAEGVEHIRQLEFLRIRRCDEVQGYLFGRPVPREVFEATYLATRKRSP